MCLGHVRIRTITNRFLINNIVDCVAILICSKLSSCHITNMECSSMRICRNYCRICNHFIATDYHTCTTDISLIVVLQSQCGHRTIFHILHICTTSCCNSFCLCSINCLRLSTCSSHSTFQSLNFYQLTISNLHQLNLSCSLWIDRHQTTFCREDITKSSNLVSTTSCRQCYFDDSRLLLTLLDNTNALYCVREACTEYDVTCIINSDSCTQSISGRYRSCNRVNFVDGSIRVNHYCIIGICPLVVCTNHISSIQNDSSLYVLTILGEYANLLCLTLIGNIEYTIITHTYTAITIRVCSFIVNCDFPQFLHLYISIDWLRNSYLASSSITSIYSCYSDSSSTYSIRLDYTQ